MKIPANSVMSLTLCSGALRYANAKRMPRLVQNYLVRRAAVAELALQGACAHVEMFGDFFLGGFAFFQSLHQQFAHTRLYVLALVPRQVLDRDGVTVPRQFGIASVERAFDAVAVEHQSILRGAEFQRCAQLPLELLDSGGRGRLSSMSSGE